MQRELCEGRQKDSGNAGARKESCFGRNAAKCVVGSDQVEGIY